MKPTDPAFPIAKQESIDDPYYPGMDLRTYMATAFLAAGIASDMLTSSEEYAQTRARNAILQADALIERLNVSATK